MLRELMCLQVHFRFKNVSFVRLTFGIEADKVLGREVLLQLLVVEIVLWISTAISPVANVASLVLFATMGVEFVVTVESLFAEATFGMAPKSGLVKSPGVVISKLFVLAKFPEGEKFVLVCENFLVSRAKIAHDFSMFGFHMPMEVRPP